MGGAPGTIIATSMLDPGVVWLSKRNKGIYEPEFRLIFVLAMLFAFFGFVGWASKWYFSLVFR